MGKTPANAWDIFVDKWKECLQSDQGVRKVKTWKKALQDTCSMPFWSSDIPFVDVRNLNRKQNLAYKIVENYFRKNVSSPFLMMIAGLGGSGKSFVINSLRQLFIVIL